MPRTKPWSPLKNAKYTNKVVSTSCAKILEILDLSHRWLIWARIRANITISSKSEIANAVILARAIRIVWPKINVYASWDDWKIILGGNRTAKLANITNATILNNHIRYTVFAVFEPNTSIIISLIPKINGKRKIATLTLSCLMTTNHRSKEIFDQIGIVLPHIVSDTIIQNTYIPTRRRSLWCTDAKDILGYKEESMNFYIQKINSIVLWLVY